MKLKHAGAAAGGEIEDLYPLSPIQQGLLFHALDAPEAGAYVVQLAVSFGAELDPAAFERAWRLLADRHPVLRTSFRWLELDEPLQVVQARLPLAWESQDLGALPPAAQAARLAAFLAADRRRGFALDRGPLQRFALWLASLTRWRRHLAAFLGVVRRDVTFGDRPDFVTDCRHAFVTVVAPP